MNWQRPLVKRGRRSDRHQHDDDEPMACKRPNSIVQTSRTPSHTAEPSRRSRRRERLALPNPPASTRLVLPMPVVTQRLAETPESIKSLAGLRHIDPNRIKFAGIYFLCRDGEVVYVGQSKHVQERILTHIREKQKKFHRTEIFLLPVPESELMRIESEFVTRFRPIYNQQPHSTRESATKRAKAIRLLGHRGHRTTCHHQPGASIHVKWIICMYEMGTATRQASDGR